MIRPELSVSVIVPILNAQNWVRQCVANLSDLLQNSQEGVEIILVDNGSEDLTLQILQELVEKKPLFRVFQSEKRGIVHALNTGLDHAKNTWIMRHDSDDISSPDRIQIFRRALAHLSQDVYDEITVITSRSVLANADDSILGLGPKIEGIVPLKNIVKDQCPFIHGAVFMKRSVVMDVGGYQSTIAHAEDFDLWKRLANQTNKSVLGLEQALYWLRFHPSSVSSQQLTTQTDAVKNALRIQKTGWWTHLDRGAIKRLVWEKRQEDAIQCAVQSFHWGIPALSDIIQLFRLVLGDRIDLLRGKLLAHRSTEVMRLRTYVQGLSGD